MGFLALMVGDPWTQKRQVFTSDALPFVPLGTNRSRVVGKVGFACNGASPHRRETSQCLGNSSHFLSLSQPSHTLMS